MAQDTLRLEGVRFGYRERLIIDDVSLTVRPGRIVALVGGSGSGKTTLLRLIGGLIRPSRGAVVFEGQALASLDRD